MAGGGDGAKAEVPLHYVIIAMSAFAILNIALNFFNSSALGHPSNGTEVAWPSGPWTVPARKSGFAFPFFYTMFHMLASCICALTMQLTIARPTHGPPYPTLTQLTDYGAQLLPLGVLSVLNNGLNNLSLTLVPLFINQVVKACAPLPTSFFEYLQMGKIYSVSIYATICCIVLGCILSNYSSISSGGSVNYPHEMFGVIACLISLVAASLKPVIAKILTSGGGKGPAKPLLSPEQAMFWDCFIAFWLYLILWLCSAYAPPGSTLNEFQPSIAYLSDPHTRPIGIFIIVFGSTLAFAFNLSNYYFIMFTGALTATIGSIAVKDFIMIVSYIGLEPEEKDWESATGMGCVVFFVTVFAYLNFQFKADQQKRAAEEAAKAKLLNERTPLAGP